MLSTSPSKSFGPKTMYTIIMLAAFFNMDNVSADSAVINNLALFPGYYTYLKLTSSTTGLNAGIASVGFVIGGPFVGPILDRMGRKKGMMAGALIGLVGVLIAGLAPNEGAFAVGRLIFGFSIVLESTAVPLWLIEISPPGIRTTMMGLLTGLCAFSCAVFGSIVLGLYKLTSNWAWKGFLMGELVTPLLALCFLPFVPESPRWLVANGREGDALQILAQLHGKGNPDDTLVQLEYSEIRDTIHVEQSAGAQSGWKSLVTPVSNLKRFSIAVFVAIFLQIQGAFNLIYFFNTLIINLGITETKVVITISVCLNLWNMIAMLIGGATVDRLGRRPALIYSSVAIGIGLIISGILMKFSAAQIGNNSFAIGAIVVIFIVEFIACATWLVLGYSYPNEVLSFKQRAKGTAIAQSIGYCFSVMVLYCFPIALEKIGWIYFVINGCWNVAFAIGMWFLFVETKGRTLEEIDEIFGGSVLDGVDTGNSLSESSVTTPVDQKKGAEVEITQQSY